MARLGSTARFAAHNVFFMPDSISAMVMDGPDLLVRERLAPAQRLTMKRPRSRARPVTATISEELHRRFVPQVRHKRPHIGVSEQIESLRGKDWPHGAGKKA